MTVEILKFIGIERCQINSEKLERIVEYASAILLIPVIVLALIVALFGLILAFSMVFEILTSVDIIREYIRPFFQGLR